MPDSLIGPSGQALIPLIPRIQHLPMGHLAVEDRASIILDIPYTTYDIQHTLYDIRITMFVIYYTKIIARFQGKFYLTADFLATEDSEGTEK